MSKERTPAAQEIMKEPYARLLLPGEDGTYTAEILEFPGCCAEGDTPTEAIGNLEDAAISWIEAAFEQGQDIPPPLAVYGYSGNINLRLPRSIHKQAARFAQKDNISLNQFFASAIAARIGAEELYERLTRRLEDRLAFTKIVFVRQLTTSALWRCFPESGFFVAALIAAEHQQSISATSLITPPARVPVNG